MMTTTSAQIPDDGLLIFESTRVTGIHDEDGRAVGIMAAAAYASLAPMWTADSVFKWALYRWDGSMDFYADDHAAWAAIERLRDSYPDLALVARAAHEQERSA